MLILFLSLALLLAGCASPPEPTPEPLPEPLPEPAPEPPPAPEPTGTAPLVGTVWELYSQYADQDTYNPPAGTVQFLFREAEPTLAVEGPVNRMSSRYSYRLSSAGSDRDDYEEGSLALSGIARDRATGRYIEYEDLMVQNLALAQGYYISGDRPAESVLTIFGGHGLEEIILFQLRVAELPQ